ncbi:MAG: hypothetical protein AAGM67_01960, partial [Bacteroidota bacterium]
MSETRANKQQQLRMDPYGGVPLRVSPENLDPNRQQTTPITEIDSSQYQALTELCQWLAQQQIRFIYVQSPLKKSNCQQPDCLEFQLLHINRCQSIVEYHGHQFIDLYRPLDLPDSVFCDEIHLHFEGPRLATEALVEMLER